MTKNSSKEWGQRFLYFQDVVLLSISTHTEAKCQQGRISGLCKIDASVVLLPKHLLNLSFPSQLHIGWVLRTVPAPRDWAAQTSLHRGPGAHGAGNWCFIFFISPSSKTTFLCVFILCPRSDQLLQKHKCFHFFLLRFLKTSHFIHELHKFEVYLL